LAVLTNYAPGDISSAAFQASALNGDFLSKAVDSFIIKKPGSLFYASGFGFTYSPASNPIATELRDGVITSINSRDLNFSDLFAITGINLFAGVLAFAGNSLLLPDFDQLLGSPSYQIVMAGNDLIIGHSGADSISGAGGSDVMYGYAGGDTLRGGSGDDWLYGGAGADSLLGGTGNDYIYGDFGEIDGSSPDDVLFGEAGNDTILGGIGQDTASGGDGNEWIFGGQGSDRLSGDAGDDVVVGDIVGESGNDVVIGGDGSDILIGGEGSDTLFGGTESTAPSAGLTTDFDWVFGGNGSDVLWGGAGRDVLYGDLFSGETGADTLYGGDGNDTLIAGSENDVLSADDGDDWIYGQLGADTISGGLGADLFWFQSSADLGDTISDFNVLQGDRLVVYSVHALAGFGGTTVDAINTGRYGFSANGTSADLWFDSDGLAGPVGRVTLATLTGVTAASLNAATVLI
jgi:Ca2+-binding RTX toxin-like protein